MRALIPDENSADVPAPALTVDFAIPAPALAGLVTAIYEVGIGAVPINDQLHPEWFNMRLPLSGEWWGQISDGAVEAVSEPIIQGPTTCLTGFGGRDGVMLGIGMMPAGWALLYNGSADRLANASRPLADYIPRDRYALVGERLNAARDFAGRAAVCSATLLARLAKCPMTARVEQIMSVQSAIADPAIGAVEALSQATGLGTRTLERLCRSAMGFTPKLLLRRQRFLRMLGQMHMRSPAQWPDYLDPFYTDQSHMIRDFNQFLGTTPTGYFARSRPILQATTAKRMVMLGAPMQALPGTGGSPEA